MNCALHGGVQPIAQPPHGEEMSVSGEFQRYLAATLEVLEERGPASSGSADLDFAGLYAGLESARLNPDTPLTESARRALLALEEFANPAENCTDSAGLLPALQKSVQDLRAISRIVLGQSAPLADRNTTTP